MLKALDIAGLSWLTCLFNLAWRLGTVPVFKKGGLEGLLQLSGHHSAQPPHGILFQGDGKEAPTDWQASDSGGAMQSLSWPWRGSWEFDHLVYICSVDLEKATTVVGLLPLGTVGYRGSCFEPSSPCKMKKRPVSIFSAQRVSSMGTSGLCLYFFTDDYILLASSDLYHALGWFAALCESASIRIAPLRPWFSTRKQWFAPSGLGVRCCPKRMS